MNSDSSEVETSSTNGRSIFMPSPVGTPALQHSKQQQQPPPPSSSSAAIAVATTTPTLSGHGRLGATTSINMNAHATNNITQPTSNSGGHHQRHHSNNFNAGSNELKQTIDGGGSPMAAAAAAGTSMLMTTSAPSAGATTSQHRPHERYVWEVRTRSPNVTPASTVLNSPDLNADVPLYGGLLGLHYMPQEHENSHHGHHQQQQQHNSRSIQHHHHHHPYHHPHHQIRVGRSPGSQFESQQMLPQGLASPGSPTDVGKGDGQCLRDGEIVVFDDIDTGWTNNKMMIMANHSTGDGGGGGANDADDVLKVTKMIGQLPIAEYEGSPRRFGNQSSSMMSSMKQQHIPTTVGMVTANSIMPKRPPGFPQRISPQTNAATAAAAATPTQSLSQSTMSKSSISTSASHHQYYPSGVSTQDNNSTTFDNLIDMDNTVDGGIVSSIDAGIVDVMAGGDGKARSPPFDYLYEFSETRKVLEEFFKANTDDDKRFTDNTESGDDVASCDTHPEFEREREREREEEKHIEQAYIGQRLARIRKEDPYMGHHSPRKQVCENVYNHSGEQNDIELYIDSNSRSSRSDLADTELEANIRRHSRNFTLSPETTDYDSNCGDLDSLSNDINCTTDYGKLYTSMPVLEDGLSSGHASDTENNVNNGGGGGGIGGDNSDGGATGEQTNVLVDSNNCTTQEQQQQQQMMLEQNEYNASLTPEYHRNSESSITAATRSPSCIIPHDISGSSLITDLLDMDDSDQQLKHDTTVVASIVTAQQQQQQHHHSYEEQRASDNHHQFIANSDGNCIAINNNNNNNNHNNNNSNNNNNLIAINQSSSNIDALNYDSLYVSTTSPCGDMSMNRTPSPHSTLSATVMLSTISTTMTTTTTTTTTAMTATATSATLGRSTMLQPQQKRDSDIQEAMKEIRSALQRAKTQPEKLKFCDEVLPPDPESPVWVPRKNGPGIATAIIANNNHGHHRHYGCGGNASNTGEEDELDTDLETDRLLGQQRLDDQGYYDDKTIWPKTSRIDDSNDQSPAASDVTLLTNHSNNSIKSPQAYSSATLRQGVGTSLTPTTPERCQIVGDADVGLTSPEKLQFAKSPSGSIKSLKDSANNDKKAKASRNKEGLLPPSVLIEGVLFRARYLGSTQLVCEGQPTKSTRMMQAEEAVSRIKAPEGESQPSTEVDLFISTEKIMVLNTDLKEIMMDHALRTISYIADIGDLVVLMARRRFVPSESCNNSDGDTNDTASNGVQKETKENGSCDGGVGGSSGNNATTTSTLANLGNGGGVGSKHNRTPKMICHVFESDEAQFIAQSIGQAFQVAYMEFLKANGIEDHSFVKEMDYQEVLNSQEIFGDELEIFAKKELQKEVVVPKAKGEILGVVIVESGWGSMLPTVVIANLMSTGAAARCGQLNIGDQLIAINGMSLVGLPLSTCQSYIRNAKNQTAVKFTVVPCPPVVEVKIKRPNTKYQLGFSVQNGVICSLLRGGIAERGGVRVGHRIIEINNQSVVAVPHEKIVNLLATSVGEILMKTMPTSMFRLLTGQENPIYI